MDSKIDYDSTLQEEKEEEKKEPELLDVSTLLKSVNDIPSSPSKKKKTRDEIMNWGFPGHLSKAEGDIYVQFRDIVNSRGGKFKDTVYSFTETEGEAHTLTRWLRARKYVLADVVTMVEEATECREAPSRNGYYPDPKEALGVDSSLFISQYPQLYSGFAKSGCPVFYTKPGRLDIEGIECITTLNGIIKYHWHVMQHDYQQRLLKYKEENPTFKRFECVTVLDLDHLTVSKLGSSTLEIIKEQSKIDSLCFPETMNKMIILNAPRFFSVTWKLIKGWLDPRTANKIELFSSTTAAQKKLRELIADDQLPSDYGGSAEDTNKTLEDNALNEGEDGMVRMITEVMRLRSTLSLKINMKVDEELQVEVYTNGPTGGIFSITDERKNTVVPKTKVVHIGGENAQPTKVKLTSKGRISYPSLKIRAESESTRLSVEPFLVVAKIYKR